MGALAVALTLLLGGPRAAAAQGRSIILATTTSVQDSGLLDDLLPIFQRDSGYMVKVIAVGSGQAMAIARRGQADVVLVHSPKDELRFVENGDGVDRRPIMRDQFWVVGPPSDPAHIKGLPVVEAFAAIARAEAPFLSRGDDSGTNVKELALWKAAGVTPATSWYRESGQGMGATDVMASELGAYTLTDDGTFLTNRAKLDLAILVEGDSVLINHYSVIRVNPDRFPHVNAAGARAFQNFMTAPATQAMIGDFKKKEFGRSLYIPEAASRVAR
jgi:tungstate transport system substrate-binding protein